MTEALLQSSMVFVLLWLALGGLGIPLPEDVALLATGVLIQQGAVSPVVGIVAVFAGVLGGDIALFFLARRLGTRAYDLKLFRRILPPARRARIESAYGRYGGRLVFLARHVAGLRGAVFAMAGIHGMRPAKFLFADIAAACLSVPLVVALGYYGANHVERVRKGIAEVHHWLLLGALVGVVAFLTWRHIHKLRARVA